jgi:hypothetical protein
MKSLPEIIDRVKIGASLAGSSFFEQILQLVKVPQWLSHLSTTESPDKSLWVKLRGSFLVMVGYLLSPLCWWNDLIINLPVAYGFGYLCSLISPDFLIPGAIAGYWLSNVVGILLMQAGFLDVIKGQAQKRNLKKELLVGVLSSTAYTAVIVLLLQLNPFELPALASHL